MVAIIVQARMGSSRLPGKVLKCIDGRPMLSYQLERLRRTTRAHGLVIATTDNPIDDDIVRFSYRERVDCFRGSENDVLSRFYGAAIKVGADCIVRVTADCPLIEPSLVDLAVGRYLDTGKCYDYVSNMLEPTWPYGMAVEVFSIGALTEAHAEASAPAEREHVTPFIYWRPKRYRLGSMTMTPNFNHHRWTVDTGEDFELISRILQSLYTHNPTFTMTDVLAILRANPDWSEINADVQQRRAIPT